MFETILRPLQAPVRSSPLPLQWKAGAADEFEDEIRQLSERVADAANRLTYEFFWFWPTDGNGSSKTDPIIQSFHQDPSGTQALNEWNNLTQLAGPAMGIAGHNIAVLHHFSAVGICRTILANPSQATTNETSEALAQMHRAWTWWNATVDPGWGWPSCRERLEQRNQGAQRPFLGALSLGSAMHNDS